jgi:hypothetical protein
VFVTSHVRYCELQSVREGTLVAIRLVWACHVTKRAGGWTRLDSRRGELVEAVKLWKGNRQVGWDSVMRKFLFGLFFR